MLKTIHFTPLKNPAELILQAASLPLVGELKLSLDKLYYLKVSDAYIHQLFPLLEESAAQKPDYFGEQGIGAHISVIYPNEGRDLPDEEMDQKHPFKIQGAACADLGPKRYYVLLIEAPSLLSLRQKAGLPDLLAFKNYWVPFHLTLGVLAL
jgi:hypothetical protein